MVLLRLMKAQTLPLQSLKQHVGILEDKIHGRCQVPVSRGPPPAPCLAAAVWFFLEFPRALWLPCARISGRSCHLNIWMARLHLPLWGWGGVPVPREPEAWNPLLTLPHVPGARGGAQVRRPSPTLADPGGPRSKRPVSPAFGFSATKAPGNARVSGADGTGTPASTSRAHEGPRCQPGAGRPQTAERGGSPSGRRRHPASRAPWRVLDPTSPTPSPPRPPTPSPNPLCHLALRVPGSETPEPARVPPRAPHRAPTFPGTPQRCLQKRARPRRGHWAPVPGGHQNPRTPRARASRERPRRGRARRAAATGAPWGRQETG